MHQSIRIASLSITVALLTGVTAPFTGKASGKLESQDVAREALERGEILPLEAVLSEIRKSIGGEVIGVELEREQGTWIYEVKIISSGKFVIEVSVDARTAKVIETRGR